MEHRDRANPVLEVVLLVIALKVWAKIVWTWGLGTCIEKGLFAKII